MWPFFQFLVIAVAAAQEAEEAAPQATPKATPKAKPIITTEIFHQTAELLYDLFDSAHGIVKPHVEKHAETVSQSVSSIMPADPIKEVCDVVKCDAQEVRTHTNTAATKAQDHAMQAKEAVMTILAQIEESLTRFTHFVVDTFETALPKYAGMIARTPMNLLLFVLYMFSVMFFMFKLAMWGLWLSSTILICLCCCGCCCLRKRAKADKAPKNGKKDPKDSKAAEKGKAATTSNKPAQGKAAKK